MDFDRMGRITPEYPAFAVNRACLHTEACWVRPTSERTRTMYTTMTDEELADELARITEDLDSIRFSLKSITMHLGRRLSSYA